MRFFIEWLAECLVFRSWFMYAGTVIDQGEAPDYYFQKYPEENPVLGFFSWRWVLGLGFDHMFTSPVFLGMLVLLAASLMACTYTTQIPMVKVARRSVIGCTCVSLKGSMCLFCWSKFLVLYNAGGLSSIQLILFASWSFLTLFHERRFRIWV